MLSAASGFKGISIAAVDGDIGSIRDLYFDDVTWTIRYLVVDTGSWLPGRQVLISPLAVRGKRLSDKVPVSLTQEQVKNSPPIDADKPVDRQQEEALARYYDQRYYWEGPYRWGLLAAPGMEAMAIPSPITPVVEEMDARARERPKGDPYLRSVRDVTGYYIAASDGDIGQWRISCSMTRRGRSAIWSSIRATGGLAKRSCFRPNGSIRWTGRSQRST
jgi:hypothetical protein